jgi:dihydropteroate synthase
MQTTLPQKTGSVSFRNVAYDFFSRTHIMGVLNVTPDSFSDGGRFFDINLAVEHGLKLAREGADIIDIGGESTRPGSEPISVAEEIRRIVPLIKRLSERIEIPISVDTYKSQVAAKALEAGAEIINDISALKFDSQMVAVAHQSDCPVILMHIKGTPKHMQDSPVYRDVVSEIKHYFQEQIASAKEAGLDECKLILDPGIGFGKSFDHNIEILRELASLSGLGLPVMVGVSRKSFIGKILDLPAEERLEGSLAVLAFAILRGANLVRVHDVGESVRVARVIDQLKSHS